MEKKIMINGMMCAHCTAHVEKALGTLEGVASVKADLGGQVRHSHPHWCGERPVPHRRSH